MEKLAFIYLEGNDSKITVFEKDKDKLRLVMAESLSTAPPPEIIEKQAAPNVFESYEQGEPLSYESITEEAPLQNTYAQSLKKAFKQENLKTIKFIPILTEPGVHYQKIEDDKDLNSLKESLHEKGKKETIGVVEVADKGKLAVYPTGKSDYLQMLNSLAKMNSIRCPKITSVKSAEISLSSYAAEKMKLKEEELSLILYIGKDYSKLIFMKGRKILLLGSTVPAGKNTSNAYYIIISKILLEMENASIHALNRIIISGEDNSVEIIDELERSYPEAEISRLEITDYTSPADDVLLGSYCVNIAAAEEYLKEEMEEAGGINLLPTYIAEEQKSFGWESYLLLLLVFGAVFAFTYLIMVNNSRQKSIDKEILKYQKLQIENQELTDEINSRKNKLANYNKSKSVLEKYSQNNYVLSSALEKISDYVFSEDDIWFTGLKLDINRNLSLTGYALNRSLLTRLSYSYKDALLSEITYEPLRNFKAYKFHISTTAGIDLNNNPSSENSGVEK